VRNIRLSQVSRNLTSCCSTDSERTHRCCQLQNKVEIPKSLKKTRAWRCPPPKKMLLSPGGSGPHLIHGSLHTPESTVQTASRSVQPFQHSSWLWQTDRQTLTARLRYICCSRPHLLLCISICGLKRSVNKRAFVSWQQTVIQYHLRLYHGYLMSHDKQHRTWGLARYKCRASVLSDALLWV